MQHLSQKPSWEADPFSLDRSVEQNHTLALSNFQKAIKEAFKKQANELELLKKENAELRRRFNAFTVTHETELESQKAASSAAIASLQYEIQKLTDQRDELFKIAKEAPETVAKFLDARADHTIKPTPPYVRMICEDGASFIRTRLDWNPYHAKLEEILKPGKL